MMDKNNHPFNIGVLGHVSHGKSTLVKAISGVKTQKFSKELERGITIKLGYANATIYQDPSTEEVSTSSTDFDSDTSLEMRKISFIDCPGHSMLLRTAFVGISVIDAIILVVSAVEKCPQPQTLEHLIILDTIMRKKKSKNIIIIQNKIDLVSKENALKNRKDILEMVKGTVAENCPIIPISAQFNLNIDTILRQIMLFHPISIDNSLPFEMSVLRSFDVNKPGTSLEHVKGGVIGGVVRSGTIKKGDSILIHPVIKAPDCDKELVKTKISKIHSGMEELEEAHYGDLVSFETLIDPNLTGNDGMVGCVISSDDVHVFEDVYVSCQWLRNSCDKVEVGSKLLLNIHSATVHGVVSEKHHKNKIYVKFFSPVACDYKDLVFISTIQGSKTTFCGIGTITKDDFKLSKSGEILETIEHIKVDYNEALESIYSQVTKEGKLTLPRISLSRSGRKIIINNFTAICLKLNRDPSHVKSFVAGELSLSGTDKCSLMGEGQLSINSSIKGNSAEKIIMKYVKEYVICKACGSFKTKLNSKTIECLKCQNIRYL